MLPIRMPGTGCPNVHELITVSGLNIARMEKWAIRRVKRI